MMKKYLSYNNNNASCYFTPTKILDDDQAVLCHSSYNSQTLRIIRSIVDELYHINNRDTTSNKEHREKRVRFTFKHEGINTNNFQPMKDALEIEKSSIKYQPVLSESATVVCCLIKGRSKVDCSVSTNDLPSLQCECATQTIDTAVTSECSYALKTSDDLDLYRSRSTITLSTIWTSSRSTVSQHCSSSSITSHTPIADHSLYSCEKNERVPLLTTAHQFIIPSKAKQYHICDEQTPDNYNTLFNSATRSIKKLSSENIREADIKLCTCPKRKLSDMQFSTMKFPFVYQDKLLEDLHLSKRSLQSMHNDGLFYIHDLVFIFLKNIPQFQHILLKHYHLSTKQADLFVNVMNRWWAKHQAEFIHIDHKLS